MQVLIWAGLIVNGLVAFVLPLVLILKAVDRRPQRDIGDEGVGECEAGEAAQGEGAADVPTIHKRLQLVPVNSSVTSKCNDDNNDDMKKGKDFSLGPQVDRVDGAGIAADDGGAIDNDDGEAVVALPTTLAHCRREVVVALIAVFVVVIGTNVIVDATSGIKLWYYVPDADDKIGFKD